MLCCKRQAFLWDSRPPPLKFVPLHPFRGYSSLSNVPRNSATATTPQRHHPHSSPSILQHYSSPVSGKSFSQQWSLHFPQTICTVPDFRRFLLYYLLILWCNRQLDQLFLTTSSVSSSSSSTLLELSSARGVASTSLLASESEESPIVLWQVWLVQSPHARSGGLALTSTGQYKFPCFLSRSICSKRSKMSQLFVVGQKRPIQAPCPEVLLSVGVITTQRTICVQFLIEVSLAIPCFSFTISPILCEWMLCWSWQGPPDLYSLPGILIIPSQSVPWGNVSIQINIFPPNLKGHSWTLSSAVLCWPMKWGSNSGQSQNWDRGFCLEFWYLVNPDINPFGRYDPKSEGK